MDRTAIIFRVLAGVASKSEQQAIAKWVEESAENKSEFRDLKLLWTNMEDNREEKNHSFDEGFRKIKEHFYARARRRRQVRIFLSVTLLFLFIAGAVIYSSLSGRTNHLSFENVSLKDAITIVEQRYHVQVEAADADLLSCSFTGSFSNMDNGYEVIRAISQALNLKCEILDKDRYRLSGIGCIKP